MAYNTNNPVGSSDLRDIWDNADVFDKIINGSDVEVIGRLGGKLKSIAALQAIITSLDLGSFTFADIASGLAGTTNGQYFRVPQGSDAQESFIYYKNEDSTALEVAKTLGQGALDKLDKLTEQVEGVATLIRFKDDSRYSAAWVDDDGFVTMALTLSGELITYGGINGMAPRDTSRYVWGISSEDGSVVIGLKSDATVEIPLLHTADLDIRPTTRYPLVWKDESGNIVFAVNSAGKVIADLDPSVSSALTEHSVTLATADTIMHVGDSLTESIWVVKDKAWMSVLSAFSPYRHVNYGVAGNTVLQMQTRVLNGTLVYGSNLQQIKPRFGFLSSFGNDYFMMDTDMKYYQESVQRAVDVMKPYCEQVVLVTEFCATQNIRTVYEEVARQNNLPYIHTDTLAYQLGKIPLGDQSLFHQGHIGTRNQGIWWYQILDWIKQQPIRKGIKIYRARTTPSAISDLVFKNDYERHKKFKELTVGHTYLTGAKDYDEIGDSTVSASMPQAKATDEYLTLQNGGALANTYSLVEIYLDQHPKDIQSLIINVASSAAAVYALSSTDSSVNVSASSLTDAFKTSYANPRSVWKLISQGQVIANSQLSSLFTGRKLSLLVVGGALVNPQVTYKSKDRPFRQEIYPHVKPETLGSELASARIVGDNGWTLSSNIKTLKPIDNKFMVRAPDSTTQLTDVFTLPVGESLAQNISFTAKEDPRKFRVQAFARYFPKGYLDLTKSIYSGLDANQTLDSTVSTNSAPVTADSLDIYRLFAEIEVSDGGYNRPGGATDYSDIVGLTWKPVTFYVHTAPYANQLKIKLTTPDGELQIARFSVKEVI
ncbi:SGNH/GDSL hydrolase family protein [Rosenbergiella epipactidis]|uniref:SGNH/GDSL hydrolase family protein n=1 Tax=Rosenbergiella epipactidis TaxID=1544694 RepID=UPI001F4E1228|nr:SGNH/GDSL hydrolase family protein [Rosenbergiella epipactidis]